MAAIAGRLFQFIPLARAASGTSAAAAMPIVDASIGEVAFGSGNVSGLAGSSSDTSSITAAAVTAANLSASMSSAVVSAGHHTPCENLTALKAQALDMKKKRVQLNADIRNAKRKTKRLKEKAKHLSHGDLMSLLVMKANQEAAAVADATMAHAGGAASASSGSSAASSSAGSSSAAAVADLAHDTEAAEMDM